MKKSGEMYHYAVDTIIIAFMWGLGAQLFLQSRRVIDIALSIPNNGHEFHNFCVQRALAP